MSESQGSAPAPGVPEAQGTVEQVSGTPGQPGVAGDLTKEAAREAIRKHKIKVDGQDIEVDEEELKRGYAHQKAANKRFQEGMSAKKQSEAFIEMMRDPEKLQDALTKMGYTRQQIRQLSEKVLAAELEDELMDPKEREFRNNKQRLAQYEALEKQQKEAVQAKRDAELKAKYAEDYSKQFVAALQEQKLPGTKGTIAEMAKYISRSAKLGYELSAQDAAKLVREDLEAAHKALYADSNAETLFNLLGDQNLNKVRQFDTSRLKNPNQPTPTEQGTVDRSRAPKTRMTPKEWRKFNRG